MSQAGRRLAALAARFSLPAEATGRLERLLGLLAADPTAPTTVTEPAAAVDVHVADSLVALELEAVRGARAIADLGAGAGFPGLPLAIALPGARVALLESVARKCAFLRRAAAATETPNAEVVCARAEEWAEGLGGHDLVTVRAVAPLAVLAEYAAPLLREGGALVAWKGRRDEREEADAAAAAPLLGLESVAVRRVDPWPSAESRHLHLYLKVAPTPDRYPRRAGMAAKRPLRADTQAPPEPA